MTSLSLEKIKQNVLQDLKKRGFLNTVSIQLYQKTTWKIATKILDDLKSHNSVVYITNQYTGRPTIYDKRYYNKLKKEELWKVPTRNLRSLSSRKKTKSKT